MTNHNIQQKTIYINVNDKKNAANELQAELKNELLKKIHEGELNEIKLALCEIVSETFSEPIDESIESLPETIDIMYKGYPAASEILTKLTTPDILW